MNGIELERDGTGADILPFASDLRRRRPQRDESGPRGEILFFTGVRYERHGQSPAQTRRGSSSLRGPRRSA
ncbi:MAG: hypothetical protein U1E62_13075 [Alsobacter sp.]